jgi:hypothetical protein
MSTADRNEKRLHEFMLQGSNNYCADCGQKGIRYNYSLQVPYIQIYLFRYSMGFMESWCIFVHSMWRHPS